MTAPAAVALWVWVFEPPRLQSLSRPGRTAAKGEFALLGGLAATWVIFGVLVYDEHRAASIAHGGGIVWRYLLTQAQVIVHYPRNQRAHVAYGSALAAHGRAADARNAFEAAVALDPFDPVAQGRLGHLYGLAHEDTAAVEHLQRAHDLQPDNPLVTTELAGILADSRDPMVRNPARALPLAEEAVRLTGRRDAAAIEVLAVTHAYLGHAREAVSLMEEAVEVARRTRDPRLIELEQRLAFYRSRAAPR